MNTEKEDPKPTWDENGYVINTEYELNDKQSLRMSLIRDDDNKAYFAMIYVEKVNGKEIEKELGTVDIFHGFGNNGKPIDMSNILREYWHMVREYLRYQTK